MEIKLNHFKIVKTLRKTPSFILKIKIFTKNRVFLGGDFIFQEKVFFINIRFSWIFK